MCYGIKIPYCFITTSICVQIQNFFTFTIQFIYRVANIRFLTSDFCLYSNQGVGGFRFKAEALCIA